MNRVVPVLLIAIAVFFITGCSPPGVEEAQVDFCQALGNYREAVDSLQEINENTTIDELKQTRDEVALARDELLESATNLRQARLRYTEDAWSNLESNLEGIPGEATLGEAADYARIEIATLLTEIDRVYNTSCGRR